MTRMIPPKVTPGQLVAAVAEVTGLSRANVADIDRRLSEAGMRSKGGRGLSAAAMTFEDAATLLVAICVNRSDSDLIAETKKNLAGKCATAEVDLRALNNRPKDLPLTDWGKFLVLDLKPDHTLKQLLVGLLKLSASGDLTPRLVDGCKKATEESLKSGRGTSRIYAYIHVDFHDRGAMCAMSAGYGEVSMYISERAKSSGDLSQSLGFGLKTIETIGALLGGRYPEMPPAEMLPRQD